MRVNFGLIPVAIAFFGWAASAQDVRLSFTSIGAPSQDFDWLPSQFSSSEDIFEARELVDELAQLERRSEILADFTTRELANELSDRLERRGNIPSKLKKTYGCVICGKKYPTPEEARQTIQPSSSEVGTPERSLFLSQAKRCGKTSVLQGGCRPYGS